MPDRAVAAFKVLSSYFVCVSFIIASSAILLSNMSGWKLLITVLICARVFSKFFSALFMTKEDFDEMLAKNKEKKRKKQAKKESNN